MEMNLAILQTDKFSFHFERAGSVSPGADPCLVWFYVLEEGSPYTVFNSLGLDVDGGLVSLLSRLLLCDVRLVSIFACIKLL